MEKTVMGTCMQMCPEEEIRIRELEHLLHRLEMVDGTMKKRKPKADRSKMVKAFCRSGVGQDMQTPEILRPPEVLLDTVDYLLGTVINNTTCPWHVVYEFIMDRLRSVRQDMVVQSLSKGPMICLLQPIVRFHAYSAYRLCEQTIENFDPVINSRHLQECLLKLLVLYDECDLFEEKCELRNIKLTNYDDAYRSFRPNIEALYVLHNLGNTTAINRALNLPYRWRTAKVNTAIDVSLSYWRGNWIRTCKLMKKLPSVLLAVNSLHLPEIRRRAFEVMSVAYNSRQLWYPIDTLKTVLLYSNTSDILSDLKYYNIICDKDKENVQFLKSNAGVAKKTVRARHETFVDVTLPNSKMTDLVLHGNF